MSRLSLQEEGPICWDGSHLGTRDPQWVQGEWRAHEVWHWLLVQEGRPHYCTVHQVSAPTLRCIVDELKVGAGLSKTGSHTVKIKGKCYLLYRLLADEVTEPPLSLASLGDEDPLRQHAWFRRQVREMLAYRHLLGMESSYERTLLLRREGRGYIVCTKRDYPAWMTESRPIGGLSNTMMEKWYPDNSLSQTVRSLLLRWGEGGSSADQSSVLLSRLRRHWEDVVMRIDPHYIWVVATLLDRALHHLSL